MFKVGDHVCLKNHSLVRIEKKREDGYLVSLHGEPLLRWYSENEFTKTSAGETKFHFKKCNVPNLYYEVYRGWGLVNPILFGVIKRRPGPEIMGIVLK